MVSLVNSHTNATRIGWYLWEIDSRFVLNSTAAWREGRVADEVGVELRKTVCVCMCVCAWREGDSHTDRQKHTDSV